MKAFPFILIFLTSLSFAGDKELLDKVQDTLKKIGDSKDLVEREVEALETISKQLEKWNKEGKKVRSILTWFEASRELDQEEEPLMKDVICLISDFSVKCVELSKNPADETLKAVAGKAFILGEMTEKEKIRYAALYLTQEKFRGGFKKPQDLEKAAIIRMSRDWLAGITQEENKEGIKERSLTAALVSIKTTGFKTLEDLIHKILSTPEN